MKTTIYIDNIKCEGCSVSIKKVLRSFPGVTDVVVDLESESVAVAHIEKFAVTALKHNLGLTSSLQTPGRT